MENKYSLYHFGVKGMRWGRRKGKTNSSGTNKKVNNDPSDWARKYNENSRAARKAGKQMVLATLALWGTTVTLNTIKDYKNGDPDTRFAIDFIKSIFSK